MFKVSCVPYSISSGHHVLKVVKGCFDRFWLDEISSSRVGPDGEQHNKLQTYSSFKCHFGPEPYLSLVQNRNQRCHLSRLRVSAHRLGCELLRYRRPPVPREQRYCAYCPPSQVLGGGQQAAARPVDDECHCLTSCIVGKHERHDLFTSISKSNKYFSSMSNVDKFKTLVCPTNSSDCKLVSRYLQNHFYARDKIYVGGE